MTDISSCNVEVYGDIIEEVRDVSMVDEVGDEDEEETGAKACVNGKGTTRAEKNVATYAEKMSKIVSKTKLKPV
ncbi:hypothetical protein INT47_002706 [Mucor saturninus]|uniref:Uncharacterized protein n=1 Tax=Mucor saturninus TaxID=64648 RepID=A0A8H7QE51_9FUNG|nr:hypothetical protein INT47_002706 [Mucor saturninus]